MWLIFTFAYANIITLHSFKGKDFWGPISWGIGKSSGVSLGILYPVHALSKKMSCVSLIVCPNIGGGGGGNSKKVCFRRKTKFSQESEDFARNQETWIGKFSGRHEVMKWKFQKVWVFWECLLNIHDDI